MGNIVIVAETEALRQTLVDCAEAIQHRAYAYCGRQSVRRLLSQHSPTLLIAEYAGADLDGVQLARELRQTSDIPVLLIGPELGEVEHLLAMRAGVDRIIGWPLSRSMLSVTLWSMITRYEDVRQSCERDPAPVEVGHLWMDPKHHHVTWKGRDVRVTAAEFNMLARLASRPGEVQSRADLVGPQGVDQVNCRFVDSLITRIRGKLKEVDAGFAQIETLYGRGYRFVAAAVQDRIWPDDAQEPVLRSA